MAQVVSEESSGKLPNAFFSLVLHSCFFPFAFFAHSAVRRPITKNVGIVRVGFPVPETYHSPWQRREERKRERETEREREK